MVDEAGAIRVAARALIVRDGAVLLQACRIGGEEVYLLPGGGQRRGETLAETVVREVREETGLDVAVGPLVWVREFIPRRHGLPHLGDAHDLHCVFACAPVDDAAAAALAAIALVPDAAQTAVRWVPLADTAGLTLRPDVLRQLLPALAGRGAPPGPAYLGDCP